MLDFSSSFCAAFASSAAAAAASASASASANAASTSSFAVFTISSIVLVIVLLFSSFGSGVLNILKFKTAPSLKFCLSSHLSKLSPYLSLNF